MELIGLFPRAPEIAAMTFAKKPQMIGEIVIAPCGVGEKKNLTEVQQYIVAECREEIEERNAKREADKERKRRQRKGE